MVRKVQPTSFIWSADKELEEISNDQLPPEAQGSLYNFLEFQNSKALSLDMTDDYFSEIFEIGVHEFFHNQGQDGWKSAGRLRGTEYPQVAAPRLYRRMIHQRLSEYIKSNGSNQIALSKAAFWFNKWKTEFENEFKNSADGYEGTAEYVGRMAVIITRLGCTASDSQILEVFKEMMNESMDTSVSGEVMELDVEGYEIGAMSSLILRFIKKHQTWTDLVSEGQSPLDLVLGPQQIIADSLPADILKDIEEKTKKTNEKLKAALGGTLENYSSPEYLRVNIPIKWMTSNFSPLTFIFSPKIADGTIIPMTSETTYSSSAGPLLAQANQVLIMLAAEFTPCRSDEAGFMAVVAKDNVRLDQTIMTFQKGLMSGSATYKEKVQDGLSWLCLGE